MVESTVKRHVKQFPARGATLSLDWSLLWVLVERIASEHVDIEVPTHTHAWSLSHFLHVFLSSPLLLGLWICLDRAESALVVYASNCHELFTETAQAELPSRMMHRAAIEHFPSFQLVAQLRSPASVFWLAPTQVEPVSELEGSEVNVLVEVGAVGLLLPCFRVVHPSSCNQVNCLNPFHLRRRNSNSSLWLQSLNGTIFFS